MLQPKRTKFRKMHKGRNRGLAHARSVRSALASLAKGIWARSFDCASDRGCSSCYDPSHQAWWKIWIRVFPDKPITNKPLEVRMGKGKGNVEYWVALIQARQVLYEMEGVSEELAREAFALAAAKLPIATTFVRRTVM